MNFANGDGKYGRELYKLRLMNFIFCLVLVSGGARILVQGDSKSTLHKCSLVTSFIMFHIYTHTHSIRSSDVKDISYLQWDMGPPPDTRNYVEDRGRSGNLP